MRYEIVTPTPHGAARAIQSRADWERLMGLGPRERVVLGDVSLEGWTYRFLVGPGVSALSVYPQGKDTEVRGLGVGLGPLSTCLSWTEPSWMGTVIPHQQSFRIDTGNRLK